MSWWEALLYGAVEGLTEFLPVSSTGHLILLDRILRNPSTEFLKSFQIAIQLGAILAVVYLYRGKIAHSLDVWKKVAAAFVPTGIIGLAAHGVVKENLLGNQAVVVGALLIGGIVLILLERLVPQEDEAIAVSEQIPYKTAVIVGCAQALALIPGVSRSGATIVAGRCARVPRQTIVEFSFLLAIPTMLAATALDLAKSYESFGADNLGYVAIGFVSAFAVALAAVRYFLSYVAGHSMVAFGVYRVSLAVLFWLVVL